MISVEITVTVPELVIHSSIVRNKIEQVLRRKTAPQMDKLFNQTTVGWSRPPKFYTSGHNWTNEVAVRVYTRSSVYAYVNDGTRPHIIAARRGRVLRFRAGYIAATSPRVLSSKRPVRSGDFIKTFAVSHPGFEARDFDVEVAEQIYPDFVQDVQNAINLGVKVSPG